MRTNYSLSKRTFYLVLISLLLTGLVSAQDWYDSDWQYRREVAISNPGGAVLTDYQVRVVLDGTFAWSNVRSDGADVRFTTSDGTTVIPYWIETWNPLSSAIIWVKIPSIPTTGTTVYLYYGNSDAASASNAPGTFIFGADFEDGTVGGLTVNTAGSGYVNVPVPTSQYMYGLKVDGWTKQPNPVLPKRPGKWDNYGTREIAPVISESDGKVVIGTDGKITAYYMGINSDGHMAIGIAKSPDGGYTWGERLDAPVIGPSGIPGSWYQWSVLQPSVLKRSSDGMLMMMAAGWSTSAYTSGSLGVFTSTDGVNWTDQGQKLIVSQFHFDASNGINQIGIPSIIKRSVNGDYLLLFSGCKTGASGPWRIFAATSSDFTGTWTPYNGGYPVFQETGTGWEQGGVATSRIVEMAPNQFVMAYSGISGSNWRVGFASTTDFMTWTRYGNNPVLQPSLSWDALLIQASFLVKADIGSTGLLYFQGFDASGAPQVGLATNIPGETGKVLHGNSATVASGWVAGNTLDPTAPFIWEVLTQTPTDPINAGSGLDIGLMNWATVPSPTTNTIWHAHDCINLQRLAGNASTNPGKFLISYTNTGGTAYYWNGSAWSNTPNTWFGGMGTYKLRILDDATNYKVDLINTSTGLSVLPNVASISKLSVRPFNLGRIIELSEPFTNYYAIDAKMDNWIVRKYTASEPLTIISFEQFLSSQWTGIVDTDWSNPSNWTAGIPQSYSLVSIPVVTNQPHITATIASPSICKNLTINAGAIVTIDAGKALTVNGVLTNNAGNTGLVIKSDATSTGSLLCSTTGVNAKVERHLTQNVWHYVSSPTSSALSGVFTDINLRSFNEATDNWNPYITSTTVPLTVMQGYAAWVPGTNPMTVTFEGILNTGSLSINVTRNTIQTDQGWNLVGNPYPSALDWDAAGGWTKTNVNNTIYYYSGNGGLSNYKYYIGSGGEIPGIGINEGTKYIPAMQGFFVHASADGSLSVNNDARIHSSQSYYKDDSKELEIPLIRLQAEGSGLRDETVIRFYPGALMNFDEDKDAYKLFGNGHPQIYSVTQDQTELALSTLPGYDHETLIPIGFKSSTEGEYTITLTDLIKFDEGTDLYLEDLHAGIIKKITEEPVYTFVSSPIDEYNRFILHFSNPMNTDNRPTQQNTVYSYENNVYVQLADKGKSQIVIYNLMGKEIFSKQTMGEDLVKIKLNTKTGYFLVKVLTNDQIITDKVFIND